MKLLILLSLLTAVLFSCKKSTELKPRTLKGKYEISKLTQSRTYIGCSVNSGNDVIVGELSDLGKIVFTGDRTVQAATNSQSNKTYIGYFDFGITIQDGNGYTPSYDKENLFEYGFIETSNGDVITLFFNNQRYTLELTFDDKNKIKTITQIGKIDCGTEYFEFEVK